MIETVGEVSLRKKKTQPTRSPTRWRSRLLGLAYWFLVAGLVGANAWKYWRDSQPLPELKTAARLLEQGDSEGAEASVRAVIADSPNYGEARLLLARVLGNRKAFAECAAILKAVPFWSPVKSEAMWHEANSWLKADRASDAEEAFRRYIKDDPNHPVRPRRVEAEIALINLLSLENRWEETRDVIWEAYDHAQGRGREELLVMSLRTFLERSSPKASYDTLRRFVAADGSDAQARLALATAANGLGNFEEADEQIAFSLKSRPLDEKVWKAWMEILKERSDFKTLSEVLKRAPAVLDEALLPYRAFALLQEADAKAATAAYEKAVAHEPCNADLQYRLSMAARQAGRTDVEAAASLRSRALRKAREELSDAFLVFVRDFRSLDAAPADRAAAMRRLARLCEQLGLERDSREWKRLGKEAAAA